MPSNRPHFAVRAVRLALRVGLPVLLVLGGVAVFEVLVLTRAEPRPVEVEEATRAVRVMEARAVPVARPWTGYGTVRPLDAADVEAEVSGRVAERPEDVESGALVSEGDLLLRLDDREYADRLARASAQVEALRAQLEDLDVERRSAETQLELAQEDLRLIDREIESLRAAGELGAATDIEIDRLRRERLSVVRTAEQLRQTRDRIPPRRAALEAQLEVAKADERLAELDLERTRIRAPISGRLRSIAVDRGSRVTPGEVVARIVDLSRVEIPLRVPVSAMPRLRVGDPAEVEVPGGDEGFVGAVARLSPEGDPATRTAEVFVEVEQETAGGRVPALVGGRFVRATLRSANATARVIVPRGAVDSERVFVVNDESRAETRAVDVAYYLEGSFPEFDEVETQWAVLEGDGLAGERVIISNLDDIQVGVKIEPIGAGDAGLARRGEGERAGGR